jgi:peptide/nickel transport system ATP-binding protein
MHPYSRALLASIPRPHDVVDGIVKPLAEIPGSVPPLDRLGPGCSFAQRCARQTQDCTIAVPPFRALSVTSSVACIHAEH